MGSSTIEALEDALITKLRASISSLKTVKRYQGDFDVENLASITGLWPCALILYGGATLEWKNRGRTGTARLTIFLGYKNPYSKTAARVLDYDLLEGVPAAIDHVLLGGYYLDPTGETMIYHDNDITIYAQEYKYEIKGRVSSRASGEFLPLR